MKMKIWSTTSEGYGGIKNSLEGHIFLQQPTFSQAELVLRHLLQFKYFELPSAGNTKGGSIIVLLASCLTGLELGVW
jgi:hypothetical protein